MRSLAPTEYHSYMNFQTPESFGKFLEYNINTYKRTILVIKGDKEFTEIIEDKIGAKQGAKKSAPDFKLYNIPLDKLIKNSNLGYKCYGIDVGLLLVADDSMSIIPDIDSLKAIINLYVWYSKNYAVNFTFNKTIINVFGRDDILEKIKNDPSININGNIPLFDEITDHLGLKVCQNTKITAITNVKLRIEKTNKKTLLIINNLTATRRKILKIDTARTLYTTYIKPSLISGLNALVLDEISKKALIDHEKYLLRKIFKFRP